MYRITRVCHTNRQTNQFQWRSLWRSDNASVWESHGRRFESGEKYFFVAIIVRNAFSLFLSEFSSLYIDSRNDYNVKNIVETGLERQTIFDVIDYIIVILMDF